MKEVVFPYGKKEISCQFPEDVLSGVLVSSINQYDPHCTQEALIAEALKNPVGSEPLRVLAEGKKNIVIIASDHTRPVPSKLIIPPMLREIRTASPQAKITILIATGCHRDTTKEELVSKFGAEIDKLEKRFQLTPLREGRRYRSAVNRPDGFWK